jgi:hypothetical protein
MGNPASAAEQLREEMRQLRSHMDADVDSIVENTRGLLDWHSYFESAPWISLGAAALAGYLLVPSKVRTTQVDLEQLIELAKHRPVVVSDQPAPAKGMAGPAISKVVMNLVWRAALALATQQLNQFLSSRPNSSGASPGGSRPAEVKANDHE